MYLAKRDVPGAHFYQDARENDSGESRISQSIVSTLFSRQLCPCHCSGDTLYSFLFYGTVSGAGKEALGGSKRP